MRDADHSTISPESSTAADSEYQTNDALVVAGRRRRLVNLVVDTFAIYVLMFGAAFAMDTLVDPNNDSEIVGVFVILILLFTMPLYYIFLESKTSRTLGKLLTGTFVVDEFSGKPTLGCVVKRTLCRLIPFEPLSFLSEERRGWHDKISNTYVVWVRRP